MVKSSFAFLSVNLEFTGIKPHTLIKESQNLGVKQGEKCSWVDAL